MSRSCKTCKYNDPAQMLVRCILCRPEMKDWEPKDRNQTAHCESCRHEEKSAYMEPCLSCGIAWPGSSSHWEPIAETNEDAISRQAAIAKDTNVPSTDCISRQAAIDALDNRFKQHLLENRCESFEEADSETKWFCDGIMESIGAVMDLPAAQPEIIRCKECKHSEHWYKDKRRCFLWHETGIDVFEDGYCNYAEGKEE